MIYFIQDGPEGPIKIGTTIRLSVRLEQLKKEHGPDLVVLAVIDGSYAEEMALHDKFCLSRLRREWFTVSSELMALIQNEGREWDGVDEAIDKSQARIELPVSQMEKVRAAARHRGLSLTGFMRMAILEKAEEVMEGRD